MADRPWVKLWSTYWTTLSHQGIGPDALLVGCVLMSHVRWKPGEDDAWAVTDNGKPVPVSVLAARAQLNAKRTMCALLILEESGFAAMRDGTTWGIPKFGKYQESADAARKRKLAGKPTGVSAESPSGFPRIAEAEAEADADAASLREIPPTPKGASPAKVESKPKGKPRKPRLDYPEGLEEHCLAELQRACRDFRGRPDAGPRKVTNGMRDELRKLYAAEEPTPADWTRAVNYRLKLNREGDKYGDLTWEHLCRPASFRRYRDAMPAGPNGKPPGDDEPPDWMLE